jgi:hypothetical protein
VRFQDLAQLAEAATAVAGLGDGFEVAEELHVDQMIRRSDDQMMINDRSVGAKEVGSTLGIAAHSPTLAFAKGTSSKEPYWIIVEN